MARREGFYEWTCFSAQQAAEKAIKALYQESNELAWGHSVRALLENLPASIDVSDALVDAAKVLDKFYILARYPNGFASGAPTDYFTEHEATEAMEHARAIVGFCHDHLA
jgi:HEPN domain-containing protein